MKPKKLGQPSDIAYTDEKGEKHVMHGYGSGAAANEAAKHFERQVSSGISYTDENGVSHEMTGYGNAAAANEAAKAKLRESKTLGSSSIDIASGAETSAVDPAAAIPAVMDEKGVVTTQPYDNGAERANLFNMNAGAAGQAVKGNSDVEKVGNNDRESAPPKVTEDLLAKAGNSEPPAYALSNLDASAKTQAEQIASAMLQNAAVAGVGGVDDAGRSSNSLTDLQKAVLDFDRDGSLNAADASKMLGNQPDENGKTPLEQYYETMAELENNPDKVAKYMDDYNAAVEANAKTLADIRADLQKSPLLEAAEQPLGPNNNKSEYALGKPKPQPFHNFESVEDMANAILSGSAKNGVGKDDQLTDLEAAVLDFDKDGRLNAVDAAIALGNQPDENGKTPFERYTETMADLENNPEKAAKYLEDYNNAIAEKEAALKPQPAPSQPEAHPIDKQPASLGQPPAPDGTEQTQPAPSQPEAHPIDKQPASLGQPPAPDGTEQTQPAPSQPEAHPIDKQPASLGQPPALDGTEQTQPAPPVDPVQERINQLAAAAKQQVLETNNSNMSKGSDHGAAKTIEAKEDVTIPNEESDVDKAVDEAVANAVSVNENVPVSEYGGITADTEAPSTSYSGITADTPIESDVSVVSESPQPMTTEEQVAMIESDPDIAQFSNCGGITADTPAPEPSEDEFQ